MNFVKLTVGEKTELINLDNVTSIFKSKSNGNIYICFVGGTDSTGCSFSTDLSLDEFVNRLCPHNAVVLRGK